LVDLPVVIVRPKFLVPALVLAALALAVAGCGSSGSSSSSSGSTAESTTAGGTETAAAKKTGETGKVEARWQKPRGEANVTGYELLKESETQSLAKSLASAFELPHTLLIKGVNGFGGGPFYNPEDNSITLPYEFPTMVLGVIAEANPEETHEEWYEALGSVNTFILAHEFGHALIHNFELPVLGREEDAADGIATVLLLKAEEGPTFAAEAAEFWAAFSGRQEPPALAEYADNHSLDRQRSDNILCWVAGSNEGILEAFAEGGVLPESRLVTCPAEWALLRRSAEQVLEPHLPNGVNLAPGT
jgi:hypothetical protein